MSHADVEKRLTVIRYHLDIGPKDLFAERSAQGWRLYRKGGAKETSPRLPHGLFLIFLDGMQAALELDDDLMREAG